MPQSRIVHREITCHTRVIDAARGTVEYIASSQATDSYGEVINQAGWQFNRFQRNAPFVDSHNYESIDRLLGKVIDFRVVNKQLVETVQWAKDVETNTLAIKGFAMTQAGYLKSVSVGFIPLKVVRPSDPDGWDAACADLGMGDLEDSIRSGASCIYVSQEQLELSACIIGANPEAVAKSYADGIFDDSDLLRYPQLRRSLQSARPDPRRSYRFPSVAKTEPKSMSDKFLIDAFSRAPASSAPNPTVTQAAEKLEFARRGQSESELFRSSMAMRFTMARARRVSAHERAQEILADPLLREFFNVLPRYACGVPCRIDMDIARKSIVPGSGIGQGLLPIPVAEAIFDLISIYGAYKELGVVAMTSQETKIGQATANPSAVWITPANQGLTTIPGDVALTGTSLTPETNTLAILLAVTRELLADEKAHLAYYLLTRFAQGLAQALDYACFSANGNNDQTNGSQTGMFLDSTLTTATSAQGNASIAQLARGDFLAAVAAVTPAALQRNCSWFISTSFIAPLMALVDTEAKGYLLKTPAETGDGSWNLVGFPVVWAAAAPAVQTPGSVIAAFGAGDCYQVGMRSELEVMLRDGATGFSSNEQFFRALARAFCGTRQASGLVKLALAAS
ncbi:MAG TPA: phage major capsid protein [Verrucomicrobiae bacterium]|jgi:HK97 family phage major capsid protein|nr:phage major capsid protein [Verrucomicrobiae bacterium]